MVLTADSQLEHDFFFNNKESVGGPQMQLLTATIANSGDVHWVGDVMMQRTVSKALVAAAIEQPLKTNRGLRTSNGFPLRFGDRSGALYRDVRDLV